MTAYIRDVEIGCALIVLGSRCWGFIQTEVLNIQLKVSVFEGNASFIPDYINLDLIIGPKRVASRFHLINPELLIIYYLGDL